MCDHLFLFLKKALFFEEEDMSHRRRNKKKRLGNKKKESKPNVFQQDNTDQISGVKWTMTSKVHGLRVGRCVSYHRLQKLGPENEWVVRKVLSGARSC